MGVTAQGELAPSVNKLAPFVTEGPQGIVLDAPEDVLAEIPDEHLAELRTALTKKNTALQQASGEDVSIEAAVWRGEHGYIKQHWYGWELGLDSYLAGKVSYGAVGAGGVATAVGASVSGPAAAIIAGAFSIFVGMMGMCKREDGWTYIYMLGTPPFTPGGVVCNPFA